MKCFCLTDYQPQKLNMDVPTFYYYNPYPAALKCRTMKFSRRQKFVHLLCLPCLDSGSGSVLNVVLFTHDEGLQRLKASSINEVLLHCRILDPLSTKLYLSDLKIHFVPRSKHCPLRL